MKQVSAVHRLQSLPSLFSGRDLTVRFRWTSKTASQYLWLWKKRGLIQALGGHSDIFANLLVERHPDWDEALRRAIPGAVIVGVEALRRYGWTTQIADCPEVAIDAAGPQYSVPMFALSPRPASWFVASRKGVEAGVLRPAWALADLLIRQGWGACGLAPDDVDWESVTDRDRRQWAAACRAYARAGPLPAGVPYSFDGSVISTISRHTSG